MPCESKVSADPSLCTAVRGWDELGHLPPWTFSLRNMQMSRESIFSQVTELSRFMLNSLIAIAAVVILRQFRAHVVQAPEQYVFVHQVLVEAVAQEV